MLSGNVLLLRMAGPLTARTLAGFAADAMAAYGQEARGFVLDYRAAAIVATTEELGLMLARMPSHSPMRRPGAFVGTAATLDTLREHAFRMALQGFPRRTFVDTLTAHEWVLSEASPPL